MNLLKTKKSNQSLEAKIKDYDFRLEFLEKKQEEVEKATQKPNTTIRSYFWSLSAEDAKASIS